MNGATVKCDGCGQQCDWLMLFGDDYLCSQCLDEKDKELKKLRRAVRNKNDLLVHIAEFLGDLPAVRRTRAIYEIVLEEINREYT